MSERIHAICIFCAACALVVACILGACTQEAETSTQESASASGMSSLPSTTDASAASSTQGKHPIPAEHVKDSSLPATASTDATQGASSQSTSVPSAVGEQLPKLTDAIMGDSLVSADSMVKLFNKRKVHYPSDVYKHAGAATIKEYCALCVEEAHAEGVRAEVLFAQAMHETAWLQFGNQVSVEQNNFGGLGAVNSGGAGEVFPDVRTGLRAQVQHLKAYASEKDLKHDLVDPRFELVTRGCAPTVFDLGGRWAWPGDHYGDAIMAIVEDLCEIEYGKRLERAYAGTDAEHESSSDASAGDHAKP